MTSKKEITYKILRWGPCVIHFKISDEFKNGLLAEAEKSTTSYGHRLAGHIKKEVRISADKFEKNFNEIFTIYDPALCNWLNKNQKIEYIITDLWCNFQKAGEFNPPHDHGGLLSFVIYLKVPKAIKEECKEHEKTKSSAGPGAVAFFIGDSDRKNSVTNNSFFPEEGDIFVFPAWLKHWVYPFKSDVTRVSVSGNITDNIELKFMNQEGIKNAIKNVEEKAKAK